MTLRDTARQIAAQRAMDFVNESRASLTNDLLDLFRAEADELRDEAAARREYARKKEADTVAALEAAFADAEARGQFSTPPDHHEEHSA